MTHHLAIQVPTGASWLLVGWSIFFFSWMTSWSDVWNAYFKMEDGYICNIFRLLQLTTWLVLGAWWWWWWLCQVRRRLINGAWELNYSLVSFKSHKWWKMKSCTCQQNRRELLLAQLGLARLRSDQYIYVYNYYHVLIRLDWIPLAPRQEAAEQHQDEKQSKRWRLLISSAITSH